MRPVRDLGIGLRAAWSAPDLIGRRLAPLLELPERAPSAEGSDGADGADVRLAVRASHAAIARLARVPGARWRNSCLYRSVAECVVLRTFGLPARVVIGVGVGVGAGAGAAARDVIAHAWVECEGVRCVSTRGQAELETLASRAT
jgi:hypothetical protein